MKSLHLKVYGHVQGVGFRFYTVQHAIKFNVTGTVQNVNDYVEIFATGSESALNHFTENVLRGASPMSRVASYEIIEIPLQTFNQFKSI
ncbi:acylphosphatase [Macrococcus capreoli]|uniref:acylphosphatase n=1 Tax=Macrococcus capreoli TaxID=2982690 RepID=UPI0021D5D42D|nr:acylphosphatase [Macrococcus sp. TMW 2.2395]MCU7556691.1 acylphosphatase [Macrococcus sp. TMW 2.2395]